MTVRRYPARQDDRIGGVGELDENDERAVEVHTSVYRETPFSDAARTVTIYGGENCCGQIESVTVSPSDARELAALLIKAADVAEGIEL